MSRLLITGASGFLGANLLFEARAGGRDAVGSYHERPIRGAGIRAVDMDLSRPGAANELLASLEPQWVINCAALANVDACERDPALAQQLNVDLPRSLAAACRDADARLLHVSSDSVFDGQRGGYVEDDVPSPVNVYARTKLEGEMEVFNMMSNALVVRANFVGLSADGQTGLADWIIRDLAAGKRISGFTDVVFTTIVANDLARVFFEMMDQNLSGLYHVGGSRAASKFEFARLLAREAELDESLVQPAHLADARLEAPRPRDTSLVSSRAESALGRTMPTLGDTVARIAELRRSGYREQLAEILGTEDTVKHQ